MKGKNELKYQSNLITGAENAHENILPEDCGFFDGPKGFTSVNAYRPVTP
jgi:hypothetical protein